MIAKHQRKVDEYLEKLGDHNLSEERRAELNKKVKYHTRQVRYHEDKLEKFNQESEHLRLGGEHDEDADHNHHHNLDDKLEEDEKEFGRKLNSVEGVTVQVGYARVILSNLNGFCAEDKKRLANCA